MYLNKNLINIIKKYNFLIKLDYKFLIYFKKNIRLNKYLNILIKNNGCKGYIYFIYISNLKKKTILINYKNLNILIYYFNLLFLLNIYIYIYKNKYKIYIIFKKYNIINNVCKCGLSFSL